jgi:transcriptional regulator with XRE-family HTH domain
MTYFQEIFIKNLRYFRKQRGLSQLKFSEMIDITPNYLNAVENGKNFPSPEVIQRISDVLEISPYQLFLEYPVDVSGAFQGAKTMVIQEMAQIKQKLVKDIDGIIEKYGQS